MFIQNNDERPLSNACNILKKNTCTHIISSNQNCFNNLTNLNQYKFRKKKWVPRTQVSFDSLTNRVTPRYSTPFNYFTMYIFLFLK